MEYVSSKGLAKFEKTIKEVQARGRDFIDNISEKLSVSFQTVKTHRKNICKKLQTGKLIDLVKYVQVFLKK